MNRLGVEQDTNRQDAQMLIPIKVVKGRAFVYPQMIEGKLVLGNPASIVICTDHFPSRERMKEMAIYEASPMTAFIRRRADDHFDIIYYTPSGEEFGLCGHATLIAAQHIYSQMGEGNVYFYRDGIETRLEAVSRINDVGTPYTYLTMPAYTPVQLPDAVAMEYLDLFSIDKEMYQAAYRCNELHDLIIVLKNSSAVRAAVPQLEELSEVLAAHKIRGLFLTAHSAVDEVDYEVRIFAPHYGIDEDISCGSANCSLLPLWSKLSNKPANYQYTILCPYHASSGELGGVESGSYDEKKGVIYIGGIISKQ